MIESQKKQTATAADSYSNTNKNIVIGGHITRWTPTDTQIEAPTDIEMTKVLKSAIQEIGDQARPTNSPKAMDPKKKSGCSIVILYILLILTGISRVMKVVQ